MPDLDAVAAALFQAESGLLKAGSALAEVRGYFGADVPWAADVAAANTDTALQDVRVLQARYAGDTDSTGL